MGVRKTKLFKTNKAIKLRFLKELLQNKDFPTGDPNETKESTSGLICSIISFLEKGNDGVCLNQKTYRN